MSYFTSGEVWRDDQGVHINAHGGGILAHKGTYYWFGEHKIEGEAGNKAMVGVHVYSSTGLYFWKDRGIALRVKEGTEIEAGCILERPKVLFCARTGKFVMWFHLEPKGMGYLGAKVGVAVADQVTGPYEFARAFRPNAGHWPMNSPAESRKPITEVDAAFLKSLDLRGGPVEGYPTDMIYRRDFKGGQMSRDMTLFMDDDGTAYHIHASEENGTLHVSTLTDDYLDTTGTYSRHLSGRFHEAPSVFRARGRYWLISSDCTGWRPNPARLSWAPTMHGPWTELGNPCRGTEEQVATTFESQATYVLPLGQDRFIYMGDRWRPQNAIDGRYVWLPLEWDGDLPYMHWAAQWDLSVFKGT